MIERTMKMVRFFVVKFYDETKYKRYDVRRAHDEFKST